MPVQNSNKYIAHKKREVLRRGAKPDLRENDKSAVNVHLASKLAEAKKKLEQMIAKNDEKGIAKMQEIISNLNQTLQK